MNISIPSLPGEPQKPVSRLPETVLPAPREGSAPASGGLVAHWVEPGHPVLDQVGAVLEDRFAADERDDWDALLHRHRAGRFLVAVAGSAEERSWAWRWWRCCRGPGRRRCSTSPPTGTRRSPGSGSP